ncbi:MAG: hypothetical protein H0X29_10170, partial [Parachlamydiaceae bacterium]|nr:hypothetical protein [Parachlamydiaceae bacterium]
MWSAPVTAITYPILSGLSRVYIKPKPASQQNDSFPNAMMHTIGLISSSAHELLNLLDDQNEELRNICKNLDSHNEFTLGHLKDLRSELLKVVKQKHGVIDNENSKTTISDLWWNLEGLFQSLNVLIKVHNQAFQVDVLPRDIKGITTPAFSSQPIGAVLSNVWNEETFIATIQAAASKIAPPTQREKELSSVIERSNPNKNDLDNEVEVREEDLGQDIAVERIGARVEVEDNVQIIGQQNFEIDENIFTKLRAAGFSQTLQTKIKDYTKRFGDFKTLSEDIRKKIYNLCQEEITNDFIDNQALIDRVWFRKKKEDKLNKGNSTEPFNLAAPLRYISMSPQQCQANWEAWNSLSLLEDQNTLDGLIDLKQKVNEAVAKAKALKAVLASKSIFKKLDEGLGRGAAKVSKVALAVLPYPITTLPTLAVNYPILIIPQIFNHTYSEAYKIALIGTVAYAGIYTVSTIYSYFHDAIVGNKEYNSSFSNAMIYTLEGISSSFQEIQAQTRQPVDQRLLDLASSDNLTLKQLSILIKEQLPKVRSLIDNAPDNIQNKLYKILDKINGLNDSLEDLKVSQNERVQNSLINAFSEFKTSSADDFIKIIFDNFVKSALWSEDTYIAQINSEASTTIESDVKDWEAKKVEMARIYETLKALKVDYENFEAIVKNLDPSIIRDWDLQNLIEREKNNISILKSGSHFQSFHLEGVRAYRRHLEVTRESLYSELSLISTIKLKQEDKGDKQALTETIHRHFNELQMSGFSQNFLSEIGEAISLWEQKINNPLTLLTKSFDELMENIRKRCREEILKDFKVNQDLINDVWSSKTNSNTNQKDLSYAALDPKVRETYSNDWKRFKKSVGENHNAPLEDLLKLKKQINETIATAKALKAVLAPKSIYKKIGDRIGAGAKKIQSVTDTVVSVALPVLAYPITTYLMTSSPYRVGENPTFMVYKDPGFASHLNNLSPLPASYAQGLMTALAVTSAVSLVIHRGGAFFPLNQKSPNDSFPDAIMYTLDQISSSFKVVAKELSVDDQFINLKTAQELTLKNLPSFLSEELAKLRKELAENPQIPIEAKTKLHETFYKITGLAISLNYFIDAHNKTINKKMTSLFSSFTGLNKSTQGNFLKSIVSHLINSALLSPDKTIASIESQTSQFNEKDWIGKQMQIRNIYKNLISFEGSFDKLNKITDDESIVPLIDKHSLVISELQNASIIESFDHEALNAYQQTIQKANEDINSTLDLYKENKKLKTVRNEIFKEIKIYTHELESYETNLDKISEYYNRETESEKLRELLTRYKTDLQGFETEIAVNKSTLTLDSLEKDELVKYKKAVTEQIQRMKHTLSSEQGKLGDISRITPVYEDFLHKCEQAEARIAELRKKPRQLILAKKLEKELENARNFEEVPLKNLINGNFAIKLIEALRKSSPAEIALTSPLEQLKKNDLASENSLSQEEIQLLREEFLEGIQLEIEKSKDQLTSCLESRLPTIKDYIRESWLKKIETIIKSKISELESNSEHYIIPGRIG